MTFKHVSKRRIAAAATALTFAGAGIAWAFGGGSTIVAATGKGRAATPAASAATMAEVDGTSDAAGTTAAGGAQQAVVGARRALRRAMSADRISVAAAEVAVARSQAAANTAAPADEVGSDDGAGESADVALRIPQRASVSLPKVTNVGLPRVEGGSVRVETLPSVQPGWKTTVDLGDPEPQVTLPKVNVGPVATVTMPDASIE